MTGIRNQIAPLALRNRLLAAELARLPDLKIETGNGSTGGLAALVEIYLNRTDLFESLFGEIYPIGRRHGKYCVPLQAIYWLAREGRLDAFLQQTAGVGSILERLLDLAWFDERLFFSNGEIRRIIDGIQSPPHMADYRQLRRRRDSKQLQQYILEDFQDKPEIFDPGDLPMIGNTLCRTRWQDFEVVCDRLNAPELLHHYLKHRLTYTQTPARGTYRTFRSGRGQCTDAAYFSRDMLDRSGYRTFVRSVKWNADPWTGLHTGAGVIDSRGRYLLVANFNGVNRPSGPHLRVDALDRCLARGNRIIDRRWGAYYPPPADPA
jgi:hypothetical protein